MKITIMKPEIRELEAKAAAWERRCEELEQEMREKNEHLTSEIIRRKDACQDCADRETEIRELRDRIGELDYTIAVYDDENRRLKERLDMAKETALNEWARRIHLIAVDHGWWESEDGKCDDGDRPFPEIVALCHSELSEALEEYRNGHITEWVSEKGKPEGIAVEMLDCMIRILDWCGHEGIDVDTLMEKKVMYNKKRPYRHGGKKA